MDVRSKNRRIKAFALLCRERGIPVTTQRSVVLKAVLDLGTHPTADEVCSSPAVRRARISRATVFRTLESLAQLGVITKACHTGGVVRYDGRTDIHHHLICLRCDGVEDIEAPEFDGLPIPNTSAYGFTVKNLRVQLRGLCRRCRKMEES